MKNSKKIFFVLFLIVIAILFVLNVRAAHPNSEIFFKTKRLYEKINLQFKSDPDQKLDYLLVLLDERLNDLNYIVLKRESRYILTTSLRYSTTAGLATEMVINNNLDHRKKELSEKLKMHKKVISKLLSDYPEDDTETKFIIDDFNYLTSYINILN